MNTTNLPKIIIAIDGYSSCGKSTLAKEIAKEKKYIYVDTGAMYRSIALYALQNNIISTTYFDEEALIETLANIQVSFSFNNTLNSSETFLNGVNVEKEIRGIEVSNLVSKVAKIKAVRQKLIDIQREIGKNKGVVMDGRDIGTIVFPNAELKIFMTANHTVRAKRRYNELKAKGSSISFEEVLVNITTRDDDDTSRTENPLIQSQDAFVLDNSEISKEDQLSIVLKLIDDKLKIN